MAELYAECDYWEIGYAEGDELCGDLPLEPLNKPGGYYFAPEIKPKTKRKKAVSDAVEAAVEVVLEVQELSREADPKQVKQIAKQLSQAVPDQFRRHGSKPLSQAEQIGLIEALERKIAEIVASVVAKNEQMAIEVAKTRRRRRMLMLLAAS